MKNLITGRQALLESAMVLAASLMLTSSLAGTGASSAVTAQLAPRPAATHLTAIPTPSPTPAPIPTPMPTSNRTTDPIVAPSARLTSTGAPASTNELALARTPFAPRPTPETDSAPSATSDTAAGTASSATDPGPAPLARPVVILYGDSLAWEVRHIFADTLAASPDVEVVTRTFGGTAICDWLDEMSTDATALQPGLVVIEFVGNNFTPCMQDADGAPLEGGALVEKYARDAHAAVDVFTSIDTQVVFAGAPVSLAGMGPLDSDDAPLNQVYATLSSDRPDVHFVDAGAAVLDDGHWTATLPCLPEEPCAGTDGGLVGAHNPVRSPDTLHFCPAADADGNTVTGDCPVWSSGAYRYGTALAQPVLDSIEARQP